MKQYKVKNPQIEITAIGKELITPITYKDIGSKNYETIIYEASKRCKAMRRRAKNNAYIWAAHQISDNGMPWLYHCRG